MGKGQEKPSLRRGTILHRPSAADTPDGAKGSDSHLQHAAHVDPRRPSPQRGAADIGVGLDPQGARLPGGGVWQTWSPGPALQVGTGRLESELMAGIGTCRLALTAGGGGGGAMLSEL